MTQPRIYLFWAAMDLLYLCRYLWSSISRGEIPLYGDFLSFQQLQLSEPGWYAAPLFGLSVLLILSIAVSAGLFLTGSRFARPVAYVQTPLRLLMVVPSLSFLPWLLQWVGRSDVLLNALLLLGSETLKVVTLLMTQRAEIRRAVFRLQG